MASKTLEQLRAQVAARSGYGQGAFGPHERHSNEDVDGAINTALEAYELAKTESGHPQRVARATVTTTDSATVGDLGWPANDYVELPADFFELQRISVVTTSNGKVNLQQFAEEETTNLWDLEWWDSYGYAAAGQPQKYRLGRYRDDDGVEHAIARLLPAADAAYVLEVIYQPKPPTLSTESDSYEFFPGTSDFVICQAAMTILESDGIPEGNAYNALKARRDECAFLLKNRAGKQAKAGVLSWGSGLTRPTRFRGTY